MYGTLKREENDGNDKNHGVHLGHSRGAHMDLVENREKVPTIHDCRPEDPGPVRKRHERILVAVQTRGREQKR